MPAVISFVGGVFWLSCDGTKTALLLIHSNWSLPNKYRAGVLEQVYRVVSKTTVISITYEFKSHRRHRTTTNHSFSLEDLSVRI